MKKEKIGKITNILHRLNQNSTFLQYSTYGKTKQLKNQSNRHVLSTVITFYLKSTLSSQLDLSAPFWGKKYLKSSQCLKKII